MFEKYKEYAPVFVRIGVGIVFLLFGFDQITKPENWFAWTPSFIFVSESTFWLINGWFDLIVGVLLLAGMFTRAIAFFASLHLLGVIFTLGYNDIAIRDFGLFLATLSVLIHGRDKWCLENKFRK